MLRSLFYAALGLYLYVTAKEVYTLFYPPGCKGAACFRPLLPAHAKALHLSASLWSEADGAGEELWNATYASTDEAIEARFELPIPPDIRKGEQSALWLLFTLRWKPDSPPLAMARVNVIRFYAPRARSSATMLLEREDADAGADDNSGLAPADREGRLPHFIYGGRLCELRLVVDGTPHAYAHLPEGEPIGSHVDVHARRYAPHFYVETFNLLRKHANPLSSDLSKAHPNLRLKLKPISLGRHRMTRQMDALFSQMGGILGLDDELDELRELLSDERIFRFIVMQIISFLHIVFDLLAFKNDIGFWKGRETMSGLSSRAVLSSAAQTVIIYLYLLDADGVNQIVIVTYTVSTALELWKVANVMRIMALTRQRAIAHRTESAAAHATTEAAAAGDGSNSGGDGDVPPAAPRAARVSAGRENARRVEAATDRFDQLATRVLYIGLWPLVAGWALYALYHYPHTSYYSWIVGSLADAVYLFGFIGMTPQLFINYKLKSVAHMPWRVMSYKAFNTFVDDAFAVLVAMPIHHKIACLRDDAVFIVFLYQRWLYPVDKRRANEYGLAYERDDGEEDADKDDGREQGAQGDGVHDGDVAAAADAATGHLHEE